MRRALMYLLIIPLFCTTIAQSALTDHQSSVYDQLMHQLGAQQSEVIDGPEGRDYIILVDAEFGQPDWNSQLRPLLDSDESSGIVSLFVVNHEGTILAALRRMATGIVVAGQAAISPRSDLPGTGAYAPQPPVEVQSSSTPPQDVAPNNDQPAAPPVAHSLASRFELVFGEDSTELIDGIYIITPTLDMVDVVAVRELRQLMNSDGVPTGTDVQVNQQDGDPLVSGTKNETGVVTLRSMLPPAPSTSMFTLPIESSTPLIPADPLVISQLEQVFGERSVEIVADRYVISPTIYMIDVVAVRELRQLMNSDSFPNEVNVRLVKGGSPLVRGTKDEAGAVTLRSMMPQASPYGSTITPRPATSPSNSSNRTLGAECTSYQTDNTSGVRCRDSSGHTWGSECTSYQHGNTSGYRCREF